MDGDGGRITLSGLLNFTDGLWSCCGNERILIFTTNHIEKLDDALLRPGRMDLHIHMSYCTYAAFKTLVLNYLMLESHYLFPKVEKLLRSGVKVTPALVSEILIQNRASSSNAMEKVVAFLEHRVFSSSKIHPEKLA
jgi:chaperone BCS1